MSRAEQLVRAAQAPFDPGNVERLARLPGALLEFSNIILTTDDAEIGATPKDVVWTHRTTTLYRFRSTQVEHPVPILLVFALINRPEVFDLRSGNSFVEYLVNRGFDVFLVDWGYPDEDGADVDLGHYVLDEIPSAIRETLRASGADEVSLVGWCIGATMCAAFTALRPEAPVRNLVLLTMPLDTNGSLYKNWVGREEFDVDLVADTLPAVPGQAVDFANKLMKPVTNFFTTYRRLLWQVMDGTANREAYQAMAKWVADNPPFAGEAYREWITKMYKRNELVAGSMRIRDELVDLRRIDKSVLVITASADHIAPRTSTLPLLDLVSSDDVTHFDRKGGHIGLMAGSKAKNEIWPEIANWLEERSGDDGG